MFKTDVVRRTLNPEWDSDWFCFEVTNRDFLMMAFSFVEKTYLKNFSKFEYLTTILIVLTMLLGGCILIFLHFFKRSRSACLVAGFLCLIQCMVSLSFFLTDVFLFCRYSW